MHKNLFGHESIRIEPVKMPLYKLYSIHLMMFLHIVTRNVARNRSIKPPFDIRPNQM